MYRYHRIVDGPMVGNHRIVTDMGQIWAYGHAEKIWPSGVSPKRASKMQLRDLDLLPYKTENIRSTISRQVET